MAWTRITYMSNIHQIEKKLLTSVTEEGSKGEVEANLRVVNKDKVDRGTEVAVTQGLGGQNSKRLRGLGWALLVLALGLISGSAFMWRRRSRRSKGGAGGGGSNLGVPSCSASTVRN